MPAMGKGGRGLLAKVGPRMGGSGQTRVLMRVQLPVLGIVGRPCGVGPLWGLP